MMSYDFPSSPVAAPVPAPVRFARRRLRCSVQVQSLALTAIAALLSPAALRAQAADASTPHPATTSPAPAATAAQPAVISPEVAADRRVTFRLRAPKAQAVTVTGQFQKGAVPMARDESGLWSATVGPVAPDVYEYSFNVDGVAMIDPANARIKPMRAPRTSILEIPGQPPRVHDFQDVPHGKVSLHWYASKALRVRRALQVYTPPGYDTNSGTRYPTLYLLHGTGDNEATWVAHGHAHWILDNLIAERRAQPMIVVMIDAHSIPPVTPATPTSRSENIAAIERDLLQDVIPLVTAAYRTKETAADRAIIGLSMGGGQSLTIGLRHVDQFAWIGGMSASVREGVGLTSDADTLNRQLKLLWFACGREDGLLAANQALDAELTKKGVRHEFVETPGAHTWPVWRGYLADFVPQLFQSR